MRGRRSARRRNASLLRIGVSVVRIVAIAAVTVICWLLPHLVNGATRIAARARARVRGPHLILGLGIQAFGIWDLC